MQDKVCVCAKVRVDDKSKIEASNKSHLDWGGEAEGMLGEGRNELAPRTSIVQARNAGQDKHQGV